MTIEVNFVPRMPMHSMAHLFFLPTHKSPLKKSKEPPSQRTGQTKVGANLTWQTIDRSEPLPVTFSRIEKSPPQNRSQ